VTIKCTKCQFKNTSDSKFCKECGTQLRPSKDIYVSLTKTIKAPKIELTKGRKIAGKYKIIEELGKGGMGVVYKAKDTKLKRTVALKFLPPELTCDSEAKDRFIQEAQAAAALDHTNICTVYEVDEFQGQNFIAMAYIKGESLKDKIESGQLDIDEALDIAAQVAEGLQEAHEKGIVHRDIKPANIMLTEKGKAKITDFGLAKLSWGANLTKTSTIMGTVAYMSPEQAKGETVDHRTDIWSLGAVLYEILTGKLPFKSHHDQAIIYSILNEEPEPIPNIRSEVPKELERIVRKALAKNPGDRYQKVDGLFTDLNSLKERIRSKARKERKDTVEDIPSIAVLPFVNMSPDPENAYFGDGLAEELINALTQLKGLRVVARTSAFRFRGRESDIREIGKQLNVSKILEGSVRKAGNRLRIMAQLINVEDGYHLWSERYDREMEDIFVIQDDITRAIVDQLEGKLIRKTDKPLVKRYTEDLEAYSLYLKGRYYWNSLTPEGWEKSFECYQKAIEIDPTYALAYVGLSIWHQSLAFWGDVSPSQAISKSRELAQKAIKLDDTISDAHNSLAVIYATYDWNWSAADREFKQALELDPANALGCVNYAICLTIQKRFKEALIHARRAQKLDPLSNLVNTWTAMLLTYMGQYEDAVEELQQVISKDPDFWQPHLWLSVTFIFRSMIEEAISEGKKAVELSGGASIAMAMLACVYFLSGRSNEAEDLFESLQERSQRTYVPSTFFVWVHLARNEVDEAFRWLQKAAEEHDPWICWYGIGPNALRASDPRFDALLKKIGLVLS